MRNKGAEVVECWLDTRMENIIVDILVHMDKDIAHTRNLRKLVCKVARD